MGTGRPYYNPAPPLNRLPTERNALHARRRLDHPNFPALKSSLVICALPRGQKLKALSDHRWSARLYHTSAFRQTEKEPLYPTPTMKRHVCVRYVLNNDEFTGLLPLPFRLIFSHATCRIGCEADNANDPVTVVVYSWFWGGIGLRLRIKSTQTDAW